jgi:starch-binding outer membrane protein, SusD/RagB family
MKISIKTFQIFIVAFGISFTSCNDFLKEDTFDTLGPENFFRTAQDAESLLNGAYSNLVWRDITVYYLAFGDITTDIMISRGGGIQAQTMPLETFVFPSNSLWLGQVWDWWYHGIHRANVVLDRVPGIEMNEARKAQILAEARFLRGFYYYNLYDLFGPVPIVLTSVTSVADRPSRPTKEAFVDFLEGEFLAASQVLDPTPAQFGRASKGAALGFLAKLYLNDKQWQKAADAANQVINSGVYSLFTTGNRTGLFAIQNKRNNEFIFVAPFPDIPTGPLSNSYFNIATPPGYRFQFHHPKTNFAANYRIRSAFIELFEPTDERRNAFLFQYTHVNGSLVTLGVDDVRSFKFPEDPAPNPNGGGNDHPFLRYADMLLTRAEALNQLNGPNEESILLINQVRNAAKATPITQGSFPNKEALNDFILDERGREFHTEALRRQDLIRHGKFIEMAKARVPNPNIVTANHVLFPIPQDEIDKNPNLTQNPGL